MVSIKLSAILKHVWLWQIEYRAQTHVKASSSNIRLLDIGLDIGRLQGDTRKIVVMTWLSSSQNTTIHSDHAQIHRSDITTVSADIRTWLDAF